MTNQQPDISKIYRMFASPAERFDSDIASMVAKANIASLFARVGKNHNWFLEQVDAWKPESLNQIWLPEFSRLVLPLNSDVGEQNYSLTAAALAMQSSLERQDWWPELEDHRYYRYRDQLIQGRELKMPLSDGAKTSKKHSLFSSCGENSDQCKIECNSIRLRSVNLTNNVVFSNISHFHLDLNHAHFPYQVSDSGWCPELWLNAVEFIQNASPAYADWAQRLLSVIVPINAETGHQISASFRHRCGEVIMSWRIRPEQLAEMMIHEASHQHFFMAGMLANYDDGSDTNLYYSPVVKKHRPIRKILLAYHAFANVVLFYRKAHKSLGNSERRWVAKETNKMLSELETLEKPLRDSAALTPMGNSLWLPLAEQLKESLE